MEQRVTFPRTLSRLSRICKLVSRVYVLLCDEDVTSVHIGMCMYAMVYIIVCTFTYIHPYNHTLLLLLYSLRHTFFFFCFFMK